MLFIIYKYLCEVGCVQCEVGETSNYLRNNAKIRARNCVFTIDQGLYLQSSVRTIENGLRQMPTLIDAGNPVCRRRFDGRMIAQIAFQRIDIHLAT